jgi:hypothetical protein
MISLIGNKPQKPVNGEAALAQDRAVSFCVIAEALGDLVAALGGDACLRAELQLVPLRSDLVLPGSSAPPQALGCVLIMKCAPISPLPLVTKEVKQALKRCECLGMNLDTVLQRAGIKDINQK